MKKSLFAIAAVTAFAGAAQAQSSVTVYGILDAGYVGGNQREQTTTVKGTNANNFAISGAESTSRLGFKGVEDLGAGKSAFFTVEVALAGDTTAALGSTRQVLVGLKDNNLGSAAIGTQYTIIHEAAGLTDPGQLNNIAGNVIYASTSNLTATPNASAGNTDAYTVRTSQTLKYVSPTMAGLTVKATYALNNDNTTQTGAYNTATGTGAGGSTNFNGWGVGADYAWHKLLVTANYQALKSVQPYGTSTTTASNPYTPIDAAWTTTTGGVNTQDNQTYAAATYDFGILKAYAQYVNRKATAVQSSNNYLSRSAQQLGVRSYITPTIEAWASLGNGRIRAFGTTSPTADFTGYQVGSNYYLSKRTNLYAIFGSTQTSTTASGGFSQNNYALGVRHTF
jgi:predicted porin